MFAYIFLHGVRLTKESGRYRMNNTDNMIWLEEVSEEGLYKDRKFELCRSEYRSWDNIIHGPYYTLKLNSYVVVVATDEKGNYICVRQFRPGIKNITNEFPAGGIIADTPVPLCSMEVLLENAKRELCEETGYVSDHWTHLMTVPANVALTNNYAFIFMAENCSKKKEQGLDETEYLEVRLYSPDELGHMVHNGEFQHTIHILAYYLGQERRERSRKGLRK